MNYYVYEWFRIDTLEVIYVGKGKGKRRFETHRNDYFKNLVSKYPCSVRLYKMGLTEQEAYNLEEDRIAELRTIGQAKANFHKGGLGGYNSWEHMSEEGREDYSNRISNTLKNYYSNEDKRKLQSEKGKMAGSGEDHPFFGKHHSEDFKKKHSKQMKGNTYRRRGVLLIDKNKNIVMKFNTVQEAVTGKWKQSFPKPRSNSLIEKCLRQGLEFHEHYLIYEEDFYEKV